MAQSTADRYKSAIAASGMTIYSPIEPGDPKLYIPTRVLEELLNVGLVGLDFRGVASRTRSLLLKQAACSALGYPVPASFQKCQPRFTGQDFDTYNQQKLNLQIWNEPVSPTRRYALARIDTEGVVRCVRVLLGSEILPLDKTGRLTTKYQAQMIKEGPCSNLLSPVDTAPLLPLLAPGRRLREPWGPLTRPVLQPAAGDLLPIGDIYRRLLPLVGTNFPDAGRSQDRLRGAALHGIVCAALGYQNYQDTGQFPDVPHQLLEVKLQTSPTIDLGLVLPESIAGVKGIHRIREVQPRHCDTRYAVFDATVARGNVTLKRLFVVTGADFFKHFRQFKGLTQNAKLQIPLPRSIFGE